MAEGPTTPSDCAANDEDAGQDAARHSRRDAMKKAALASSAAAVVWAAPRVEGFRVAPDYAAAASGTNASQGSGAKDSSTVNYNCFCFGFGNTCCETCWATTNNGCSGAVCGNCTNTCTGSQTGSLTIAKFSGNIVANYSLSGDVSSGGPLNVAVSGIDPPFQTCNVVVNGTCSNGTFVGGGTQTLNDSGNLAFTPRCSGANCNMNASVTITLACNFA